MGGLKHKSGLEKRFSAKEQGRSHRRSIKLYIPTAISKLVEPITLSYSPMANPEAKVMYVVEKSALEPGGLS